MFYAGSVVESKGVLDLISAVNEIKALERNVHLQIAGNISCDLAHNLVKELNLELNVEFLGLVDHDQILTKMNSAEFVIVPSHHAYPEGLPMTIMESLMVHTPVIASDHPMFVGRVGRKGAVQFFPEKNAKALAKLIVSNCETLSEYETLCNIAPIEWHDLCLDLKWGDMINTWINDPFQCDFSEFTLDKILQQENPSLYQ